MSRRYLIALAATGALVSLASWSLASAAEIRRSPMDQREVDVLRAASPRVLALLEQGEEQARMGALEESNHAFEVALGETKGSPLLLRRHCEALTALGRRDEAVKECYRALETNRSNENIRATVRALVSGPRPPTMAEAALALDLAAKTNERAPGQLTPTAAFCDIAASLGDGIMLQHCANALERIAPEAKETRSAMALLSSRCPPWRFWSGAAALGLALAATGAHSFGRRSKRLGRSGKTKHALAAGALALLVASVPRPAAAEVPGQQPGMLSKWAIDDENPERSIPGERARNEDPLEFGYWLQDIILRAEVYSKHGKHDTAVKLYTALAIAVPERAVSWTKMCDEYEAMGQIEKARASCEVALLREGLMVKDYEHYVHLVLATPGPLTERQTLALEQVLTHLREDPAGRSAADALEGEIALRAAHDSAITAARWSTTRRLVLALSIVLFLAAAAFVVRSSIKARATALRA